MKNKYIEIEKYKFKDFAKLLTDYQKSEIKYFIQNPLFIYESQEKLNKKNFYIISEKNNKYYLDYFDGKIKTINRNYKNIEDIENDILELKSKENKNNYIRDYSDENNTDLLVIIETQKNKLTKPKTNYYSVTDLALGINLIQKAKKNKEFNYGYITDETTYPQTIYSSDKGYEINLPVFQEKIIYNEKNLPPLIEKKIKENNELPISLINEKEDNKNIKYLITKNQENKFSLYKISYKSIVGEKKDFNTKNSALSYAIKDTANTKTLKFIKSDKFIIENIPVRFNELNSIQKLIAITHEKEKFHLTDNKKETLEETKERIVNNENLFDFSTEIYQYLLRKPQGPSGDFNTIDEYIKLTMNSFLNSNKDIKLELNKLENGKKELEKQYENLQMFTRNLNKKNPEFANYNIIKKIFKGLKKEQINTIFNNITEQANEYKEINERQNIRQNQNTRGKRR